MKPSEAPAATLGTRLDQDECYRALCAHDVRYDGRFFTCVHTTGIFCRPGCPARVPNRPNCLFVESAASARALGFRACKRCRPEAMEGSPAWDQTATSVRRALRLIQAGGLDTQPIGSFAASLGMGERHLRRLIQTELGIAPHRLALVRRASFARNLVESSDLSMLAIAEAAGFGSLRRFNDVMLKEFGVSPNKLRNPPNNYAARSANPNPQSKTGALRITLPVQGQTGWPELFAFFKARAIEGVESTTIDTYTRTFTITSNLSPTTTRTIAIAISPSGPSALSIQLSGAEVTDLYPAIQRIRSALDLNTNLVEVTTTLAHDPVLRPLLAQPQPLRLPGAWDSFELAARAVLGQQISVQAARTIAGRLASRYGNPVTFVPGLSSSFPQAVTISTLNIADLVALGLTKARAHTLIGLAKACADADFFSPAKSLENILARFITLDGIGPWTAAYIALRVFRESDAFPASDLGLRKAFGVLTGTIPSEKELEKAAEAWRPWRGYAAQYLWNSLSNTTKAQP